MKRVLGWSTAIALLSIDMNCALAQSVEEITVTARKREETLNAIPLSISAFTAKDLDQSGQRSLEDIQFSTSGLQYSNMGGSIPGRYDSAIRFRGMNVNAPAPSLQLASLFIDGTYVLGGVFSIPYDDVERIEVIKGPQSAYFGRNTFGGAINYISKTPSLTEYKGQVKALGATYNEFDISASHEGPIVADRLAYRAGGRFYSKGGQFTASDGGKLGEESSKSVYGTLFASPTDNLTLKFRGFFVRDEDGPAAGGIIAGNRNDSCTGKTVTTNDPAFPTVRPTRYICGQVPVQGRAISNLGTFQIIDSNTSLRPGRAAIQGVPNYVIDQLVNRPHRAELDVPFIDHMGIVREITRFSANIDYTFQDGHVISAQGGYNRLRAAWIRDYGQSALENWYSRDPQDGTDYGFEARITSPQDQRLTYQVGANYYHQRFLQAGTGGETVSLCTIIAVQPLPGQPCPAAPFTSAINGLARDSDIINAWGIFAALSYDITDTITLNLEGRYQNNNSKTAIVTATPITGIDKNFLPRAILQWQPSKATNVYASYAKGVIQGTPNATVAIATPRELLQYQAAIPGVSGTLPAETLNMYELGWKQSLWDGRVNFSSAAYYGDWKNMKGQGVVLIREDCGSPNHLFAGGCTTGSPLGAGLPGQPATNLDGSAFLNTRSARAPGTMEIWGLEFTSSAALTEAWDAHLNVTYARSRYKFFLFNALPTAISGGFSQQAGNESPRFPKWSGSFASTYTGNLNETWEWYVAGELNYFGKAYADESNLAYCNDYVVTNARVGITKPGLRVEAFVKNALDDKNWASCARTGGDFDTVPTLAALTANQGVAVVPQNKRQFGLRTTIDF